MIIGLVGQKQAGKDTTAAYLKVKLGTVRVAFADKLKALCGELFNIDFSNEENKVKHRDILQHIGETARQHDQNVWCNYVFRQVDAKPDTVNVITDVRYLNEMTEIKNRNGILVRINRPGCTGDAHISEREMNMPVALKMVDYFVDNSGTMSDFETELDKLIVKLQSNHNIKIMAPAKKKKRRKNEASIDTVCD